MTTHIPRSQPAVRALVSFCLGVLLQVLVLVDSKQTATSLGSRQARLDRSRRYGRPLPEGDVRWNESHEQVV